MPLQYLVFRDFVNDHLPEIINEIYIKNIYLPYVIGKKDLIIADLGANQGVTAYYFAPYAKMLYAIEPSKTHLETLKEMCEKNHIENIHICPYAISNTNGKTKFYHTPNPTSHSLTNLLGEKQEYEEVETVTIEEFMNREKIDHIDILKLDIEGEEGKLIASPEFVKMSPKINVILGEYHDWSGVGKDLFMNMFRDLGYNFAWNNTTQAATFSATRI